MEGDGCEAPRRRSTVKEDKALLLLGYTGTSVGRWGCLCCPPPLTHAQIHTGGRGDACVGTKVFPLPKLKPLITNRETGEGGVNKREEMVFGGDLEEKSGEPDANG